MGKFPVEGLVRLGLGVRQSLLEVAAERRKTVRQRVGECVRQPCRLTSGKGRVGRLGSDIAIVVAFALRRSRTAYLRGEHVGNMLADVVSKAVPRAHWEYLSVIVLIYPLKREDALSLEERAQVR